MGGNRHTIRMSGFDYSACGYYFVTICTQNREYLFGNVINGKIILNEFGRTVDKKINELQKHRNVEIDIYCVMPNHVHLILTIVGADPCVRPLSDQPCVRPVLNANDAGLTRGSTPTVGEYVKRLKTLTTRVYIENVKNNNWPSFDKRIWQRNYYERIIRDERELNHVRRYIRENPQNWETDQENPTKKRIEG